MSDSTTHYHIRLTGARRRTSTDTYTLAGAERELAAIASDLRSNPLSNVLSSDSRRLVGYVGGVGAVEAEIVECRRRHRGR